VTLVRLILVLDIKGKCKHELVGLRQVDVGLLTRVYIVIVA